MIVNVLKLTPSTASFLPQKKKGNIVAVFSNYKPFSTCSWQPAAFINQYHATFKVWGKSLNWSQRPLESKEVPHRIKYYANFGCKSEEPCLCKNCSDILSDQNELCSDEDMKWSENV